MKISPQYQRFRFIPRNISFRHQIFISPLILFLLSANILVPSASTAELTSTGRQFILDVQQLLQHNQQFYNKYGTSDYLINLKFFEAKDAAEGIFQRPDIFEEKVASLQKLINAKLSTFPSLQEHLKLDPAAVSNRANSIVPDKMMLVLASTIGGFSRIKK